MIHAIPGDPVRTALGGITAQPELVAARRHDLGLDKPLAEQYVAYLGDTVTGDFGTSIITGQPVSEIISDRLPNTLQLVGAAFVFTIVVAYPLGLGMAIFTQNGRHRKTEVGYRGRHRVRAGDPRLRARHRARRPVRRDVAGPAGLLRVRARRRTSYPCWR